MKKMLKGDTLIGLCSSDTFEWLLINKKNIFKKMLNSSSNKKLKKFNDAN